jgi:hypothetical protein
VGEKAAAAAAAGFACLMTGWVPGGLLNKAVGGGGEHQIWQRRFYC